MEQIRSLADLFSKAIALHQAGNLDEAEIIYKHLRTSHPKNADVLALLGAVQVQRGNPEKGIYWFEKAIAASSTHGMAYLNYGKSLAMLGKYSEAAKKLEKALVINPNDPEAYNTHAAILKKLKQYNEALASCEKAIAINPGFAIAHNNRGVLLKHLKQYEAAMASYDKAIALNPAFAEAYNNRGSVLQKLKKYDDALINYNQAIAITPNYAEAHSNRGLILEHQKQYETAMASYDKAIAINPNFADAYLNKSLLYILLGEYEKGWELYEWRWKKDDVEVKVYKKPLWLGKESLVGKTILIHAEQGLGDTIEFCRYIPMVEALGAKVILEVPPSLVGVISTLKNSSCHVLEQGTVSDGFDFHCPLLSLPLALKATVYTIPTTIPYLAVDAKKQKVWEEKLGIRKTLRIGLVWSGAAHNINDHNRSMALEFLTPLLSLDFDFFSLQKQVRPSDESTLANSKIINFTDDLGDFSDTAALLSEMDIIISVDTSVAHLAGALGKKLWVLLPFVPGFRWKTEKEESPWYPDARLFIQQQPDDWGNVVAKVKEQLAEFLPL